MADEPESDISPRSVAEVTAKTISDLNSRTLETMRELLADPSRLRLTLTAVQNEEIEFAPRVSEQIVAAVAEALIGHAKGKVDYMEEEDDHAKEKGDHAKRKYELPLMTIYEIGNLLRDVARGYPVSFLAKSQGAQQEHTREWCIEFAVAYAEAVDKGLVSSKESGIKTVSKLYGVTPSTVYRWRKKHSGKTIKTILKSFGIADELNTRPDEERLVLIDIFDEAAQKCAKAFPHLKGPITKSS